MPRRKRPSELPSPAPVETAPSDGGPITLSTPWRSITAIPRATWERLLRDAGSPLLPYLDSIIVAVWPYNALGLAQAYKESSLGKDDTARQTFNALGLMVRGNEPYVLTAAGRKLQRFPSWADGFANYRSRLRQSPYTETTTLGELIDLYLMGWLPDIPPEKRTFGPQTATKADYDLYRSQTVERLNAWGATAGTAPAPNPVPLPNPLPNPMNLPWPAKWIKLAGTLAVADRPIPIPADVEFIADLTPVGPNRPGRKIETTGMTWHQTGNRSVGADANMHRRWQNSGTPGHPDDKVGVHFYVDDKRIVQMIPIGENSIHSGDWRNNAHVSMEECINADRNSAKTERNAMAVAAGVVGILLSSTALDDLYPHGNSATGCPILYTSTGRWNAIEAATDDLIRRLKGATPSPAPEPEPTYATAYPVPKEWDGTDYRREDGALFIALRRVFVAAQDGVKCHQSADPGSPEVRRALNRGEAFEALYVVFSNYEPWLVSRYGSRIQASQCTPDLDIFSDSLDAESHDIDPAADWPILSEPTAGLSGDTVADDAPALTKAEFMAVEP